MKLRCDNCGEIVESGLANITKHQFEDCKAVREEKIPDCDWATLIIRPYVSFTPIEEENNNNNQHTNNQ